jgi:general secretion pathway protein J
MSGGRGFTLLELLIGLALLSLMLALLFGGFRVASASWNAVETRIERSTHESIAKGFVRRLLTQLQPLRWKKTPNQPVAFHGEPNRIVAIAPLTGQTGSSGIRLVSLSVEPDDKAHHQGVQLILRETQLRHESENFGEGIEDAQKHPLLNDLAEISFAFFGAEKKGGLPGWHDVWPNKEELPRLIRVTLVMRDTEPVQLMVAPMVSGSRCHWDPFYKRCR